MDKKGVRRFKKHIRPLNPWYFLVLTVIFGIIAAQSLRQNNVTALRLRDEVTKADQADGDVEGALRTLREYVYSHMNTDLASGSTAIKPPIQLKYRYDRLVQAEKDRVSAANANLYTEAQKACEKQFPQGLSGSGRIPCIQNYITSHGGAAEKPIPDSLYKFDFVSPFWSPDLAGWSLLIASISLALFALRMLLDRWVKAELHDLT